jgi:hypothetical protein
VVEALERLRNAHTEFGLDDRHDFRAWKGLHAVLQAGQGRKVTLRKQVGPSGEHWPNFT